MKIPVVGMDPSLTNWGIAEAELDMDNGWLSTPKLSVIQPRDDKHSKKQVRRNSLDLLRAEELATEAMAVAKRSRIIFVEVPHGGMSVRSNMSRGVVLGVLGSLKANGHQIIEVSATENKKVFTGNKNASKQEMIDQALETYPNANWPKHAGTISLSKAEHLADAIAAIHAGVLTPMFQQVMSLLRGI